MALNFPSTTGQATDGSFTHTESGVTWAWDGITWKSQAVQTQQSESDPVFLASPAGLITSQDVTEWDTSYGWGDHGTAGYLTSLGDAAGVTTAKISNWDTSYGWGDHAAAGYLTSYTPSDTLASVVARGSSSEGDLTVNGNLYVSDGSGASSSHRLYNSSDDFIIQNNTGSGRVRVSCRSGFEVIGGVYSNKLISIGGNVSLYKDNGTSGSSVKLSTSADGISIYGDLGLGSGDLTTTGKLYYSNNFANSVDLPSASTYHGMFAHVHAEGHGYFAHGGAWTQLLDTGSSISELADVNLTVAPQSGQVLAYDGSNWVATAASGGGGGGGGTSLGSRQIFSGSTSNSHANNASENITIAAYKGYALYKVSVSEPSWVTLYVSTDTRTSDANRAITQDPAPGSGVLAEVITQSSSETVLFTPALIGYNDDSTPGTNIYLKVVNKSGSTQSINVELTVTQLEA